jgi:ribonuclease G
MSDRNFSRRRRGGMRFRPSGGFNQNMKPDRSATEARAAATGEKQPDAVFESARHDDEIARAENIAAGLPPEGEPRLEQEGAQQERPRDKRGAMRRVNLETAEEVAEEKFEPVPVQSKPPTLIDKFKRAIKKLLPKREPGTHKEIIINAESLETRIALQEVGRLEEFTIERNTEERLVGSIFKGKVRNLEDPLKAAFVDIGFEKNSFLHYWDIVPTSFDSGVEVVDRGDNKQRRDRPRITQRDIPRLYPPGSEIIVQVTKGPIGTKGTARDNQSGPARALPGAAAQFRPKRHLAQDRKPGGAPAPEKNPARNQPARRHGGHYAHRRRGPAKALLHSGPGDSLEQWNEIQQKIKSQPPPCCVFQEPDLIERTVRDFLTDDVSRVVVDSQQAYDRMRAMISRVNPRAAGKVQLYNEHQPIFDRFNVTRQLENAFSRQVHFKSGGYIVIDETEALVAIDVNTGRHKSGHTRDHDSTIVRVNLEAADEICRQLRLRNMGGLIVLDFIDMKSRRDQQAVYQRIKEGLRRDKAKTHVLPISQLGLMEMTRQRHSESVRAAVYDDCPYCKGRGKVKSAITMSVEIQRKLNEILKARPRDDSDFRLRIAVHPTVLERLRTEDEQIIIEMEKRYFGKLSFRPEPNFHAEQFKIVNEATNEELANVGS